MTMTMTPSENAQQVQLRARNYLLIMAAGFTSWACIFWGVERFGGVESIIIDISIYQLVCVLACTLFVAAGFIVKATLAPLVWVTISALWAIAIIL